MSKPSQPGLTEMEGATLAMIGRDGPLTAYAIKEAYRNSPSASWSGSAGAVYPMTRRLEERGLLRSQSTKGDGRGRRAYRLTPSGKRAMAKWLTDVDQACGLGFDPLRTRLFFGDLMPPAEQLAFVSAVAQQLQQPVPSPRPDDEATERLHEIWLHARRRAVADYTAELKKQM